MEYPLWDWLFLLSLWLNIMKSKECLSMCRMHGGSASLYEMEKAKEER